MTVSDVLQLAGPLPTLSPAAIQLLRCLGSDHTDPDEVLKALKYAPGLTARLLRICNSPALGLVERIASVDQALLLLGYRRLQELVLEMAAGDLLGHSLPAYAIEARTLWHHCLVTAQAAQLLAQTVPAESLAPDVAFTAGLLHDVGKLVLASVLNENATSAVRAAIETDGATRHEAENQILGVDHAAVGGALLHAWNLPEPLPHAAAAHHQPCHSCQPPICSAVHLANCLAHLFGADAGWDAHAVRVDPQALERWKLDAARLEGLLLQLAEQVEALQTWWNLR